MTPVSNNQQVQHTSPLASKATDDRSETIKKIKNIGIKFIFLMATAAAVGFGIATTTITGAVFPLAAAVCGTISLIALAILAKQSDAKFIDNAKFDRNKFNECLKNMKSTIDKKINSLNCDEDTKLGLDMMGKIITLMVPTKEKKTG